MRDAHGMTKCAEEHGIAPLEEPSRLRRRRQHPPDFVNSEDRDNAHGYMLHRRHYINGKVEPSKRKSAKLGLLRHSRIEKINSTFSLQERQDAVEALLQPDQSVGLVQAIIDLPNHPVLDINTRTIGPTKASKFSRTDANSITEPSRWLQTATERNLENHVQLLVSRNPTQSSLDESLAIAIQKGSKTIVTELLRYDSNINTCHPEFIIRSTNGDAQWTELFLSSRRHVVDQRERDEALAVAVESGHFGMARLLLTFQADANHSEGFPIIRAIQRSDLRMTILLLLSPSISEATLRRAIESACTTSFDKASTRLVTIRMLLLAGVNILPSSLESLLRIAMGVNDTALVALLIRFHQLPATYATAAMKQISTILPEDDVLCMSRLLLEAGAQATNLGSLLHWAVKKDYDRMIALLCDHGVSIDFQNAKSVQFALGRHDTKLLKVLLSTGAVASHGSTSTDTILATALPKALGLSIKNKRREAVQLLLQKGVKGPFVDQALLEVIIDPTIHDVSIVKMLLGGRASVNYYRDGQNCMLIAAQNGSLTALSLLAAPEHSASAQLLSHTIQRLFQFRAKSIYNDFIKTLKILFNHGKDWTNDVIAQTLVAAICAADDEEGVAIVRLFLQHGADVNYKNGQAIREAIHLTHNGVLAAICATNSVTESSFAHALPPLIKASRANQSKLSKLVCHCRAFPDITGDALLTEITEGPSGGQDEIVRILLDNGADVNHKAGVVFSKAIEIASPPKSLSYMRLLLAKGPLHTALRTAFTSAMKLNCASSHRHDLFQLILEAGFKGKDIDVALADTIISDKKDATIPRLLLRYKADVNHDGGSILASATDLGNIQLVAILVEHGPTASTVNRSFKVACHAQIPETRRIGLFECLFTTNLVSRATTTYALTHAVTNGTKDPVLLGLLSRHKPTIEVSTLLSLIRANDISTTQLLLKLRTPTQETCSAAFRACLDLEGALRYAFAELLVGDSLDRAVWEVSAQKAIDDQDLRLLKLLLLHSSNKLAEIDAALVFAAGTLNPTFLRALLSKRPSCGAQDQAFEKMLTSQKMQSTYESRSAATALLKFAGGISQSLKDRALVQSFETYRNGGIDFYRVLIEHGADVTTQSCICFMLAGQVEDLGTFDSLLQPETNFDLVIKSLVGHFPQQRYERLVELMFITVKHPFYNSKLSDVSVIFDAMHRFSQGVGLMKLLLDHGYPAGQTIRSGERVNMNTEPVTPVIWALGQPGDGISDDVILMLLDYGQSANPDFTTRDSGASAATLAAQRGRHAILKRLIELNVDVSAVDHSGQSPLFYATANKDNTSVSILLGKGTHANDGSLHEAARLCQSLILKLLLKTGHDPDYTSDLHGGRTALGELCSQANVRSGADISAAYETMKLLINALPDLSFRTKGKTVLHLALENDQPVDMTRVLLRFPEVYKDLRTDSETFLYQDSQGRFMSPDIYAQRYCRSDDHYKSQLIAVLESKCKTKWFTKTGVQLSDCKGLPRELEEMKREQDLADQLEQRAVQRRQRSADMELQISQQHHRNNMLQSKQQVDLNFANLQRLNDQQVAHDSKLSEQRRLHMNSERASERFHIQESNRLTYTAAQQKHQLDYSSQKQMKQLESSSQAQKNQQRYSALEREAALEKKTIESREASQKRMKQLEYSSQTQKNQQRYAALQQEAGLQKQMKQIENSSQDQKDKQRYAALQREGAHERKLIEDREAAEKRSQARLVERLSRQDRSLKLLAQEQRGLITAAKEAKLDALAAKLPALTWNEEPD